MRYTLTTLSLLIAFGFCGSGLLAQNPDLEKAFNDKGGYKEKAFAKAPKRAFIKEFAVYFQVLASAEDRSDGGGYRSTVVGATKTTLGIGLTGPSLAQLHAITDGLYAEYVKELTDNGFTLVSADEAAATGSLSDWTRFEGGGQPSEAQLGGYLAFTPKGQDFFFRRQTASGKTKGSFLIDNAHRVSDDLDDAVVISVSLVVPFVELEAGTSIKLAQMGSKIKATVDLKLANNAVEQQTNNRGGLLNAVVKPDQVATYANYTSGKSIGESADAMLLTGLKKPVAIPGVAEKKKIVERTSADVSNAYQSNEYNLAGQLMVRVDDRDTKTSHVVEVDGAAYERQVSATLKGFLDMSMAEFLAVAK